MRKTKIVATIGPASDTEEKIESLILAGVDVFRFNMKHNIPSWHADRIQRVQKVADIVGKRIGILIDLQGPEIREKTFNGETLSVTKNQEIKVTLEPTPGGICIPNREVIDILEVGDTLLIDDGFMEFEVLQKEANQLLIKAADNYEILDHKGVNLPGKDINLPSIVEEDLEKLDMAATSKVDYIALSFSRTREDIEGLRSEMKKRNIEAKIVAKIESKKALDNLEDLIEASDSIMVARGDLGIEVPIEQLAFIQERIVKMCREKHKSVIVATQMLQSMISSSRPTRAEATDIANAVFDGADALMLSGETATGSYPVKAVEAMARIAAFNEGKSEDKAFSDTDTDKTSLIVAAAMRMVMKRKITTIDKIVVFTQTGYTARVVSSYRPDLPIIAVTDEPKTAETLTLTFGVFAYQTAFPKGKFTIPAKIIEAMSEEKILQKGESILIIHGDHWREPGLTNTLTVATV